MFNEESCLSFLQQQNLEFPLLHKAEEGQNVYICNRHGTVNQAKCYSIETNNVGYENEMTILRDLSHTNIVSFRGSSHNDVIGLIITEYVETNMLEILKEKSLSPEQCIEIFTSICKAIEYLHSNGIAHLDIRPDNILVNSDLNIIKISEFSSAISFERKKKYSGNCGTFFYCAPEIFKDNSYYPEKADIWSLGILLHVLLTRTWPYSGDNVEEIQKAVQSIDINFNLQLMSPAVATLIDWMLDPDPIFRPTVVEVLNHPWFISSRPKSSFVSFSEQLSNSMPSTNNNQKPRPSIPIIAPDISEHIELASQNLGLKSPNCKEKTKACFGTFIRSLLKKCK